MPKSSLGKEETVMIKTNSHQIETEDILQGFLRSYRELDANALKDEVDK